MKFYTCADFLLPLGVLQMASDFCIQSKNSEEYKVVQKHFEPIVSRIQHVLPVLANVLFSRDLISDVEHDDAMNSNQSKYTRASVVMKSILSKIENDISSYSRFVSALKDSDLEDFATTVLESSLKSEKACSSTLPHIVTGECTVV